MDNQNQTNQSEEKQIIGDLLTNTVSLLIAGFLVGVVFADMTRICQ